VTAEPCSTEYLTDVATARQEVHSARSQSRTVATELAQQRTFRSAGAKYMLERAARLTGVMTGSIMQAKQRRDIVIFICRETMAR